MHRAAAGLATAIAVCRAAHAGCRPARRPLRTRNRVPRRAAAPACRDVEAGGVGAEPRSGSVQLRGDSARRRCRFVRKSVQIAKDRRSRYGFSAARLPGRIYARLLKIRWTATPCTRGYARFGGPSHRDRNLQAAKPQPLRLHHAGHPSPLRRPNGPLTGRRGVNGYHWCPQRMEVAQKTAKHNFCHRKYERMIRPSRK